MYLPQLKAPKGTWRQILSRHHFVRVLKYNGQTWFTNGFMAVAEEPDSSVLDRYCTWDDASFDVSIDPLIAAVRRDCRANEINVYPPLVQICGEEWHAQIKAVYYSFIRRRWPACDLYPVVIKDRIHAVAFFDALRDKPVAIVVNEGEC